MNLRQFQLQNIICQGGIILKTEYDDTPNHDDNDNENEIPINVRPELP